MVEAVPPSVRYFFSKTADGDDGLGHSDQIDNVQLLDEDEEQRAEDKIGVLLEQQGVRASAADRISAHYGRQEWIEEEGTLPEQSLMALQQLGVVLATTALVAAIFLVLVALEKAAKVLATAARRRRRRHRSMTAAAMVAAVRAAHVGGSGGRRPVVVAAESVPMPMLLNSPHLLTSAEEETHPAALVGTYKPCKNKLNE